MHKTALALAAVVALLSLAAVSRAQDAPQGCADDNVSAEAEFGEACPSLAQDARCSDTAAVYTNVTVFCPVSCRLCVPNGSGTCSGLDDSLFMLDTYGLSCPQIATLGQCGTIATQDVQQRCPIACGLCKEPISIPCLEDKNSTYVMDTYGLSCQDMSALGMCPIYGQNAASLRVAEVMRQYCPGTCRSCATYYPNIPCATLDNNSAVYRIFRQNCTQMKTSCHTIAYNSGTTWLMQFLQTNCPQACGYCAPATPPVVVDKCADSFDLLTDYKYSCIEQTPATCAADPTIASVCAGTCNRCASLPINNAYCQNDDAILLLHGLPSCSVAAQMGYCVPPQGSVQDTLILSLVRQACSLECNLCLTTPDPTTVQGTTIGPCHNNDAYMLQNGFGSCQYMAQGGNCDFTAQHAGDQFLLNIMAQQCPLACGFCECKDNNTFAQANFNVTCVALAGQGKCDASPNVPEGTAFSIRTNCPVACLQCAATQAVTTTINPNEGPGASSASSSNRVIIVAVVMGTFLVLLIAVVQIQRRRLKTVRADTPPLMNEDTEMGSMSSHSNSEPPFIPNQANPLFVKRDSVTQRPSDYDIASDSRYEFAQTAMINLGPEYETLRQINSGYLDVDAEATEGAYQQVNIPGQLNPGFNNKPSEYEVAFDDTYSTAMINVGPEYDRPRTGNGYLEVDDKVEEGVYEEPLTMAFRVPGNDYGELCSAMKATQKTIQRQDVTLESELGSGSFGQVMRGTLRTTGNRVVPVAVKLLKAPTPSSRTKFMQEAAIMAQFSHMNVCKMHGVVADGEPVMLVLELLQNGSLYEWLRENRTQNFEVERTELVKAALDIASAMTYLHSLSFIHRDLAARNCLIGNGLQIKLADFGLARDVLDNDYYRASGGAVPLRWTPPEALFFRKFSPASDVWSFGVTLYEIWTGARRPYGKWTNDKILAELDQGYRLPLPPGCSTSIYSMMLSTWHPDPDQRPSMKKLQDDLSIMLSEYQVRAIVDTEQDVERVAEIQRGFVKQAAYTGAGESTYETVGLSADSFMGFPESDVSPEIVFDASRCKFSTNKFEESTSFYQPLTLPADVEDEPSPVIVALDSLKITVNTSAYASLYERLGVRKEPAYMQPIDLRPQLVVSGSGQSHDV